MGDWVAKQLPSLQKVFTDTRNGRFRLVGSEGYFKSVSWTKRGMKVAALESLQAAWRHYTDCTGEKPPIDMGSLAKDIDAQLETLAA